MATFDDIRVAKNSQKKTSSVSSAVLNFTDRTVNSGESVSVFNLPAGAVVTSAYFYVGTGVTGATATGKITVGSTDAIAAVAFAGTAGAVKGGATTKVATGDGAEVTVTIGTANATAGEVTAVVEYTEFGKASGELTNV